MTLNPRNYDLDELRRMAGNGGDEFQFGVKSRRGPEGAEAILRSNQQRELALLDQVAPDATRSKPYLTEPPSTYAAEVLVFEWLEYLVAKVGFQRAAAALSYYASIGWITDEAEAGLREYLRGVGGGDDGGGDRLDMDDHLLSLIYVARLSAMS